MVFFIPYQLILVNEMEVGIANYCFNELLTSAVSEVVSLHEPKLIGLFCKGNMSWSGPQPKTIKLDLYPCNPVRYSQNLLTLRGALSVPFG